LLGLGHVFNKLDRLGGTNQICATVSRCAQHHDVLAGLEAQFAHVCVIFELTTLDEDLLSFGLDVGKAEELELEIQSS
jgi:hypothetical protein